MDGLQASGFRHIRSYAPKYNIHLASHPISIYRIKPYGGERSMALWIESAERFSHRANIARYQKILATYLTVEERRFVERRLAEEQAALQQFAWNIAPESQPTHAA
jgi:hypothetical protein